ncbi:hypothetical protein [Mucilaginibacter myungsuensis]|uniref:Uncharacterized protein n=1 Tax=Mucilaginibacter myungsuensis TaxID=649104 RepID=A0A929KTN5_9SPHI|nr:hypothetical protein [Mucilaginibacter myungsuensis]MBE9660972.1 hypothetical protein [Mucilaginibacter myungsuensis]MDN3601018.1 hypothetical protein [Mucilaginibacter myungsuensis]
MLRSLKNLFALIATLCVCQAAFSQDNANIIRIADKTFSVGTYARPFRMEKMTITDPDTGPFWNWAVCIEMCLNYAGLNVSQDQVMSLVNGTPKEPLGTPSDLTFAINKTTPPAWGKPSKIYCAIANVDPDVIFDELHAGRPMIMGTGGVGTEGTAYMITAMQYTINYDTAGNMTGITPVSITLRDPWPNGKTSQNYIWNDFLAIKASLYTIKVEFKK